MNGYDGVHIFITKYSKTVSMKKCVQWNISQGLVAIQILLNFPMRFITFNNN